MANIYLQQKAENTLKRADDLIETGQKRVAFQELQAIIAGTKSNKHRQWNETVEEVMLKFIELCVDLRKGQEAKSAITLFKLVCLPDHANSLDKVLKTFVELAEQRASSAQAQSNSESLTLQKDLEDEIPESILMSEVSGEDLKDRMDREIVTPWLKFLWEVYRVVLDVLKLYPNKELQIRYHDTSQRAFKFCKEYKRKAEFRRLAEVLRTHLSAIQKYGSLKDGPKINLNNAETLQNYLDTRFKQLDVASDLELWNESFKLIEDIHALIRISKKAVDPALMIKFYEHLTKIFWVSENYLLHAYAYYKLFNLRVSSKKEDNNLQLLSSTLLLSALSIPSSSTEYDIMNIDFVEREKQQRMAFLLGLTVPPTKEQLLEEIIKRQVTRHVLPELSTLYQILEVDFHPLDLCSKMSGVFKFLESRTDLSNYTKPLKKITLSRLLPQLSKVYEVIKISEIVKLAGFVTVPEIEREIVLSVQQRHLQATIDHQSGSIIFGKSVAPFDSDYMRSELIKLAGKLSEARRLINPQLDLSEKQNQEKLVKIGLSKLSDEHSRLLERKQFIEKKKIFLANEKKKEEEEREVKLREAAKRREEEEKKEQERQQQKLEEEAKKRKEEEEKIAQAQRLLQELEKNNALTDHTIKALAAKTGKKNATTSDITAVVDVDTLIEVKREEIEREKREREKKLTDEAKSFDYLERARRLEEIPLLKEHFLTKQKEDREEYERTVQKAEEEFNRHITEMSEMKAKLEKMFEDKDHFVENFVMKKRREAYEKKLAVYNKQKEEAKAQWLARREKIKQEVDKKDEERRQREKEAEEKERRKREEEEQAEKQRREREEKLRRTTELQQQKEREIEEKLRKQKEEALKKQAPAATTATSSGAYKPPQGRWGSLESEAPKRGRFDDDNWGSSQPSRRRFDDDSSSSQPPRRRFDDDNSSQPPRRRFDDDNSGAWQKSAPPKRRFDDDDNKPFDSQPSRRRFDDDSSSSQPPRRRFDDDNSGSWQKSAPPKRRFDDDNSSWERKSTSTTSNNKSSGDSGEWQRARKK